MIETAAVEKDVRSPVIHPLLPIYDENSRTLFLGTMPSPASRAAHFYYAHPQNRFWPVLAAVYGEDVPKDNESRTRFALCHGLALWDVLHCCEITGASDASIRNPVPNDIAGLITRVSITRILTTGATATKLYRKLVAPSTGLPCTGLPSTSAANARMTLADLTDIYRAALLG